MSKSFVKIEDFLLDQEYLKISGYSKNEVVPENGTPTEIVLADHSEVYRELMYQYGERAILIRDTETALTVFTNLFTDWVERRGDDIATLVDAYQRVYNPIENYDRTDEHGGYDTDLETPDPLGRYHKTTQTPTAWKTSVEQKPTNWIEDETQTPTNWITTEKDNRQGEEGDPAYATLAINKVVPFNGTEALAVGETETHTNTQKTTEQGGSFKTSTEQKGTYTTDTTQSGSFETKDELVGTLENKRTYNSQLHSHGNIGTASAQDLIEKEYRVRMIDLLKTVVLEFINEYTVYA